MVDNNIVNLPSSESKTPSALLNRTAARDALQQMQAHLEAIKESEKKLGKDNKFYGYVLFSNPITSSTFEALFKENKEFITDVKANAHKGNVSSSASVLEIYVHIPQVTDFLPLPDIQLFKDFMQEFKSSDGSNLVKDFQAYQALSDLPGIQDDPLPGLSGVAASLKKKSDLEVAYDAYTTALELISLYPKVYQYTEIGQRYAPGQVCQVQFPNADDSGLQSMAYGLFIKEIGGVFEVGRQNQSEAGYAAFNRLVENQKNNGAQ